MKPLIHHTVYPDKYNRKLQRGTAQWALAFNKWSMYVRGEILDDRLVYEAKKLLK